MRVVELAELCLLDALEPAALPNGIIGGMPGGRLGIATAAPEAFAVDEDGGGAAPFGVRLRVIALSMALFLISRIFAASSSGVFLTPEGGEILLLLGGRAGISGCNVSGSSPWSAATVATSLFAILLSMLRF